MKNMKYRSLLFLIFVLLAVFNPVRAQKILFSEGKSFENIYSIDMSALGTVIFICDVEINDKIIREKILKYNCYQSLILI